MSNYGNILNEYLRQVSLDKQREETEDSSPVFNDDIEESVMSDADPVAVAAMVNEMKNDLNDMVNSYAREYKQMTDSELSSMGLLKESTVSTRVVRAYCPMCGEELVCCHNPYKNPHNGAVIARHNCKCGFKANLEHAFPYIEINDKDEIVEVQIQA